MIKRSVFSDGNDVVYSLGLQEIRQLFSHEANGLLLVLPVLCIQELIKGEYCGSAS